MLAYEFEQAPHERTIIRNSLLSGMPIPKAIQNAPSIELQWQFFYIAFWSLNSTRNYRLGPIPYQYIREYAFDLDLSEDQFDRLLFVIEEMDKWYLNYLVSKESKRQQKPAKHGKGTR